jgi:hypothetical protein
MKKNRILLIGVVLLALVVFFLKKKRTPSDLSSDSVEEVLNEGAAPTSLAGDSSKTPLLKKVGRSQLEEHQVSNPVIKSKSEVPVLDPRAKDKAKKNDEVLRYVLDEGLAVVQGDIVVGQLIEGTNEVSGYVKAPAIKVWNSREIPFYIQPSVKNPERITQALALFSSTAIRFVPFENQQDVLVFEDSNGVCKSYVGKIGGKQPIWVPLGCEAPEIAHELMHALGFVHEQNRTDRDQFIEVLMDNVEPQYKENFVKLSADLMRISGLEPFDFESLMIYPATMFAKSGKTTMRSKDSRQSIRPGEVLSTNDIERINKAFGGLPPE